MKQIKAIIRPDLLDEVRKELDKLECCRGIMVSELVGHGTQNGITHSWGGEEYRIELLQKVCVDVVVKDDEVDAVTDAIIKSASIGQVGDGKIFIYNVEDVIRIRTGEHGEEAL